MFRFVKYLLVGLVYGCFANQPMEKQGMLRVRVLPLEELITKVIEKVVKEEKSQNIIHLEDFCYVMIQNLNAMHKANSVDLVAKWKKRSYKIYFATAIPTFIVILYLYLFIKGKPIVIHKPALVFACLLFAILSFGFGMLSIEMYCLSQDLVIEKEMHKDAAKISSEVCFEALLDAFRSGCVITSRDPEISKRLQILFDSVGGKPTDKSVINHWSQLMVDCAKSYGKRKREAMEKKDYEEVQAKYSPANDDCLVV